MRRGRIAAGLVLAMLVLPGSASADETGSVAGTLTVAAPCITIDITNIDFGTAAFNTSPSTNVFTQAALKPAVQNCSGTEQNVLAAASDATNSPSGAVWTVATTPNGPNHCPETNKYSYQLGNMLTNVGYQLTTVDQYVSLQPAGVNTGFSHTIVMPCVGSAGAGLVMNTLVSFTAIF